MAEMKDAHILEIPVDEEHQQKLICAMNTIAAFQNHPSAEISSSPGHFLLLKLWKREEDLFGRRIALKESRMDSIKSEIFQLCCFFLAFHWILLTISFTSSVDSKENTCENWRVPSLVFVCTSLVFVSLVQVKICRFWKVSRQLQRERNDNRALTRCIQELRMEGASFDLSKEPLSGKRMKRSSVELKWKPLTWCSQEGNRSHRSSLNSSVNAEKHTRSRMPAPPPSANFNHLVSAVWQHQFSAVCSFEQTPLRLTIHFHISAREQKS